MALTTSTRMYGHLHLAQGAHGTKDIIVNLAMCAAEQGSKKLPMHTDDEGAKHDANHQRDVLSAPASVS